MFTEQLRTLESANDLLQTEKKDALKQLEELQLRSQSARAALEAQVRDQLAVIQRMKGELREYSEHGTPHTRDLERVNAALAAEATEHKTQIRELRNSIKDQMTEVW